MLGPTVEKTFRRLSRGNEERFQAYVKVHRFDMEREAYYDGAVSRPLWQINKDLNSAREELKALDN